MEKALTEFFRALGSPSAPWTALVIAAAALYLVYMLKSGMLSVKTDKIMLGKEAAETEQVILRRQVEHITMTINGTFSAIPRHPQFDEWRTRFVLEKVIDEFVNLCMFNHLDTNDYYIHLKQNAIWAIVQKYIWNELYQSDSFRSYVDTVVRELIIDLVNIRKVYGKQGR